MATYTDPQRILIIQLRRIGDVLMCTPVIRALRQKYPQSHLAFLTEEESKSILENNPNLNQVIVWDKNKYSNWFYALKKIKEIRDKKFDLVIDLLGTPRTALASFLSGSKKRIGFAYRFRKIFYNLKVVPDQQEKYGALYKLDSLKPLRIEPRDCKLDMVIDSKAKSFAQKFFMENKISDSDFKITISPTARRRFNFWFLDRYAQVADGLMEKYSAKVILVWGPGEKEIVEKIASLMKFKPITSSETSTLLELAAILGQCDLHLGNDNGTKHIATAVGVPTVTIYGPHSPVSWTYPDSSQHKFVKKNCPCVNNERKKHSCTKVTCLDSISVDDVQQVLNSIISNLPKLKNQEVEKTKYSAVD
ncbi:MAG TPA: glycosyltransferase family 9 protein [candidate division Zixibacteria bacterium]|nr:glycosyltransferase family 9 protein [candidate division Zixibacteria bacterium]